MISRLSILSSNIAAPDAWRKSPSMRTKRQEEPPIETAQTNLDCQWMTGLTAIEGTPFLVATGAATKHNFFVLENTARNQIQSEQEDTKETNAIATRSIFSMPSASYHLSSYGNKLISSGPNGTAQIFKLDPRNLATQGLGVEQIHECTFNSTPLSDLAISPPEKMITSVRINRAAFEPCAVETGNTDTPIRRVVGLQGSILYLYDIVTGRVVGSENFSTNILSSFSFSPHSPFGSLSAVGSHDSTVSILDSRLLQAGSKSVVWSIKDAHEGVVTDVSFNPFLPFWLATSGEDGVIKMWDIRYLKGNAVRINAHYSGVSSIAWSNTHCDIISSSSYDRSWRAFNINSECSAAKVPWREFMVGCPGSEYETLEDSLVVERSVIGSKMIGEFNTYGSPLVSVIAAPEHSDTFYTATTLGVISSHTIKSKVYESLLSHRYENGFEREVESAIQSRHLNEAYETMVRLSRSEFSKDSSIAQDEAALIKLCTPRPAILTNSWKLGGYDRCDINEVRRQIRDYSYGLPPRFEAYPQWTSQVSQFIQVQFELVLLRHSVTSEIYKGNWAIIEEKERQIMGGIEVDDEYLDLGTIKLIIETMLVNKYQKGLTIGLGFAQILADIPKFKFQGLSDLMSLLIFPTVYDNLEWLPSSDIDLMKLNSFARQTLIIRYLNSVKHDEKLNMTSNFLPSRRQTGRKGQAIIGRSNMDDEAQQNRKMIKAVMGEGKKALPMISLEVRLLKLVEAPPEDFHEEIIRIMQNVLTDTAVGGARSKGGVVPFERTISVVTNRLYLNSLFESKRFDEYFGVSISLIQSFNPYAFSQTVLKHNDGDGFAGMKGYILSMLSGANSTLNSTLTAQSSGGSVSAQFLISGVKLLKDATVMVVKIAAHFMDGLDLMKLDKDCIDTFSRMMTNLTAIMLQVSAALLRGFEHFDRLAKIICKEFAHTVHDALRDATRAMPLSGNRRPASVAEKAATGLTIQEEAFSVLEKLYKGYLKVES